MRTKGFRLLTVLLAAVMLVALSINVFAAQSNAITQDGLTVQMFTDKNSYKMNESVKVTVQVNNNTGQEVFIFTSMNAPEGVTLANDNAAYDAVLANGETWTTPGGAIASDGKTVAGASTATGDNMQAGFWCVLTVLMVCSIITLFVYGKNSKTWLSVLLCMAMIGGLTVTAVPVQASGTSGDIQLSCIIQVDGKDTEVTATVSYVIYDNADEAAAEESTETMAPSEDTSEVIRPELTPEILAALDDFRTIYDDDMLKFLAGLYDPATGGFYFAYSARNTEGFGPDVESTGCIVSALNTYLEPGERIKDYFPEGYGEKMITWVQSLQDVSEGHEPYLGDGYFYHPQWGKNIRDSRRNRDLGRANTLLGLFDAKPMEPTALERIEVAPEAATAASTTSDLPKYVQSKEALIDWLENDLDFDANPYSAGNTFASARNQITAAGLMDEAIEWLNAKQNPETGLWGEGVSYNTVNGLMKIAVGYTGYELHYAKEAMNSVIQVALSDERAGGITWVYNPWHALNSIRSLLEAAGEDTEWYYETLYEQAPAMIAKTKEKLIVFRKADGGFSYTPTKSSTTSQGAKASLGLAEGDVNATTIAINGLMKFMLWALGQDNNPVFDTKDVERFMELLQQVEPTVKEVNEPGIKVDFENGKIPSKLTPDLKAGGSIEIITVPTDTNSENKALKFTTIAGEKENLVLNFNKTTEGKAVTVEFRLMVETLSGSYLNTDLMCDSAPAYRLLEKVEEGNVEVGDVRQSSKGQEKDYREEEWFAHCTMNQWHDVKVVYTPPVDGNEVNIKVYVDGKLEQDCAKYYYADKNGNGTPKTYLNKFKFGAMINTYGTVYIDDINIYEDETSYTCPHTELVKTEAKAATCAEAGNIEYWTCDACDKLFSDENATTEIKQDNIVIKAGHTVTKTEAKEPTSCIEAGNIAYWTCSLCSKLFSDEAATTEITQADTVKEGTNHTVTKTEAKEPTSCTEAGNIEYWTCSLCSKLFSDENATTEITQADTVKEATGHTVTKIEAKEPTSCTESGNIEHWSCSLCSKLFSDEAATTEITQADIIKKVEHSYTNNFDTSCDVCNAVTREITIDFNNLDWDKKEVTWNVSEEGVLQSVGSVSINSTGMVSVDSDPTDSANKVLKLVDLSNSDKFTVTIPFPEDINKKGSNYTVEFRLYVDELSGNLVYNSLMCGDDPAYQLLEKVEDGNVKVGDRRQSNGTYKTAIYNDNEFAIGDWHNVKVIYTPPTGENQVDIEVWVGKNKLWNCNSYYFDNKDGTGTIKTYIDKIKFGSVSTTVGTVYIDDIKISVGD